MAHTLSLDPDQLLTTTRAVRKRLDYDRPVPRALLEECVEIALQAPSGSNARGWHFVAVGDPDKRAAIGELYRRSFDQYREMPFSAHALAKDAKVEDRIEGFTELGMTEHFSTATLERRIKKGKVVDNLVFEEEQDSDDFDPDFDFSDDDD